MTNIYKEKSLRIMLRSSIKKWIEQSIEVCNGKCVISGKPFDEVHHKISFEKLLEETFDAIGIENYKGDNLDFYTKEQQELIKEKFNDTHYKYGYGACLTKEYHIEFHNLFGNSFTVADFDCYIYCKNNNILCLNNKLKNNKTRTSKERKECNTTFINNCQKWATTVKSMIKTTKKDEFTTSEIGKAFTDFISNYYCKTGKEKHKDMIDKIFINYHLQIYKTINTKGKYITKIKMIS